MRDYGTPCFRKRTSYLRLAGSATGVEVSHDDVIILEVEKKVKVWCEIGGTVGYRGNVNIMNVYGDIVDGDSNSRIVC